MEEANDRLKKELLQKDYAVSSLQEQLSKKNRTNSPVIAPKDSPVVFKDTAGMSPQVSGLVKQVEDLKKEIEVLSSPSSRGTPVRSPLSGGFGKDSAADSNRLKILNDELMTWKDRSESLMSELQSSKRKLSSMESDVTQSRELLSQAQEAKEKAERQYKSARDEIAQLRAVAEQNSTDLKSQLKHSQGVAARHASDADTVSTHAESLQRKTSALMVEKDSMERSKDEALSLANQAKDAARVASAEKEAIAKQLDQALLQLATVKAKYDSLDASKRASDAQFEALCAKLESAHSAAQMNEANAVAMADRASDVQDNASNLMKRLQATQERCDAAELSMEAMRAQLGALQEEFNAKCEEHNAVATALDGATVKLSNMTVDGSEVASQNNALLTAKALLEERVAVLVDHLDERDANIREMADQMSSLTTMLEKAQAELKQKELHLNNAGAAIATAKSKSIAEGSNFESQADEMADKLDQAHDVASTAEKKALEAQELYVNAVDTTKKLRESLAATTHELDETKEFLQAESDRADALSGLLENREDDLKKLRQEVSEAKAKAYQADELLEELEESKKKMDMVHQQLTNAQEQITSLKEEVEEKENELAKMVAMKKDRELCIESLESALTDKSGQIEDIKQHLDDAEDKLKSFEERAMQAEMRASDAKNEARDYEIAAEDAQREIQRLNKDLQVIKEEMDQLQQGTQSGDFRIDDSPTPGDNNVHTEYKEQISALEKQLETEQELRKTLESEVRVEKRRSMAANMKAAGLQSDTQGIEEVSRNIETIAQDDVTKASIVEKDTSEGTADHVVKNLVNSILDKYN